MAEKCPVLMEETDVSGGRDGLRSPPPGVRYSVNVKKFEILQKETANSTELSDCVPVIMDLLTCELNVEKSLRQSLLRSLVQMVVSSETVVRKLSTANRTDMMRVMREHVMTQYKHYQLYMHYLVTVMKCMARVMKQSRAKETAFIKTKYLVGKDLCTMLDVLLKPIQYLVNMNKMFNDLGCMLLNKEDTGYLSEIKCYLTQVFNKIQNKIDLMSETVDEIFKRYEKRCESKLLADENWQKLKEKLKHIFEIVIVKPCSFTVNLYLDFYFPTEEQTEEYLKTLVK